MSRISGAMALTGVVLLLGSVSSASAQTLIQRTITTLPTNTATDQNNASFTIQGLSGITYAGGNTFWSIMDNSDKLVKLSVNFNSDGSISAKSVAGGLTLSESKDFEGIALAAGGQSVYASEEATPSIRQYNLTTGALMGTLPLPSVYTNRQTNLGLEALSRRGQSLWTGNEEALSVDGALSTPSNGTTIRLQHFDLNNPVSAGPQYAYTTAPIHDSINDGPRTTSGTTSRSGLADMVVLPDGRLLTLERSFAKSGLWDLSSSYQTRIYLVDPQGATDVSGLSSLIGQTYTSVTKTLLWSNKTALGGSLGNLEGLALGPQLANGSWVILGVVDNNAGNDPLSANRLISFEFVPEPASLLLPIMLGIGLLRRSRNRCTKSHSLNTHD
ncbi:MAG: esterase-like activity of phytase family protein [Phycisphaerales bacterium]|nr:esterase-like activity of phytase family protein [Phycisphaerales bacterium]